jgi:uncharacterized damage-inducible protein DinB
MTPTNEPQLAAPGAGLPAVELFIGRILFALRRAFTSRAQAVAHFERERAAIGALVSGCDGEAGARRVLIPRGRGMEDSSRFWSVWMTLDHLRIVNGEFARVIRALTNGVVPDGAASTATVKPSPDADASVMSAYEEACDAFLASAAQARDLRTPLRYAHPWFGPLDAAGWHALGGGHMGIHRVQIGRILAGLRAEQPA